VPGFQSKEEFCETIVNTLSKDTQKVTSPVQVTSFGDKAGVDNIQAKNKGAAAARLRRSKSLPREIEGRLSIPEPKGFECDTFENRCRVCYERPCEVVTLPCRHFFMCQDCLRRHIYSRPRHRGGRNCPLCRRFIKEVIHVYSDAAIPQYGFAIRI
jgi:hypothetical protein